MLFTAAMFSRSIILKLMVAYLLLEVVSCRSYGPPQPRICDPSISLVPQHEGTAPKVSASPFSIEVEDTSYVAGATINGMKLLFSVNLKLVKKKKKIVAVQIRANSLNESQIKGFMIQARPSENGEAFGAFRLLPTDEKSRLFGCPDNTTFVRKLM